MKILGIDTSTRFLCIGVHDDRRGTGEYRVDLGRQHSRFLLPALKRILESLNLKLKDFDYFAVGLGPGSFTGIRLGVSVVKGFAYALDKPVVGISTLDILAFNARASAYLNPGLFYGCESGSADGRRAAGKISVCPVVDAKRNLVYSSMYRMGRFGLKRVMSYKLITIDELLEKIPSRSLFLGDALGLYKQRIVQGAREAVMLDEDYWYPRPGSIIELATERIRCRKLDNARTLRPLYLYPKECQIKNPKRRT